MTLSLRVPLIFALAAPLAAQPLERVGFVDIAFRNPTNTGSAQLQSTVYYPAQSAGRGTPVKAKPGGWPGFVFLHGLGGRARNYTAIGGHFAARGYVVVLNDTGQFNSTVQANDAVALFAAMRVENQRVGAFFRGAFDMRRVGVGGHSMGGGNTVRTLAANAGYVAGIGFAPWDHFRTYPPRYSPGVRVPLAIVHGTGDTVVNWQTSGLQFWQLATAYTGSKTMYLMNADATHNNVAILRAGQTNAEVFARSMAVATGFLDAYVKGTSGGLEQVIGPTARAERRLQRIYLEVERPPLWQAGSTAIGTDTALTVAGQPGVAGLLIAARRGNLATPFGSLLLDPASMVLVRSGTTPATGILTTTLSIPNDVDLVGKTLPFQALATVRTRSLRFSNATAVTLTR